MATAQRAYAHKLFAGTSGNLSARAPEDTFLITPSGTAYDTMQAQDIVRIDMRGNALSGALPPSSEWRLHASVYACCPEVMSVFQTHSPFATAFAVVGRPIPQILVEMGAFLGGDIPCVPFETPGTWELGEAAANAILLGRNACLLESHGALAVGKDVAQAYLRAEYLEEAVIIYHHALQIGEPKPQKA